MKIALVHDYLNQWGGAERVLEVFTEIWPEAPIYTSVYNPEKLQDHFVGKAIHTSFLDRIFFAKLRHRPFLALMPLAFERFDLREFDVVLSSSASFAKGVLVPSGTMHICYCHTPPRFLWEDFHDRINEAKRWYYPGSFLKLGGTFLRFWDFQAAHRPDVILANSKFIAGQINKFYHRNSEVIPPPADTQKFKMLNLPPMNEKFFLVVSRLLSHKKVHLAIEAFNELGFNLKIIGTGPEEKALKKIAAKNIDFLGNLSDDELIAAYNYAQALIVPQVEDFGLVTVEALLCGTPAIAYRKGGSIEIIEENLNGIFFNAQTKESLQGAIKKFMEMPEFDKEKVRKSAMKFDKEIFKRKIQNTVLAHYKKMFPETIAGV